MQQSAVEQEAGSTAKRQHHPAWLQHEINKAHLRKQQTAHYEQQQNHKHHLVTQQASHTRNRIRSSQPPQPASQQHTVAFIDNRRPATCTPHGRGERSRPKWAMTAAEEEKQLDAECDELVGFVAELDYNQWMEDMEERGGKQAEEEKENGHEEEEDAQDKVSAVLGAQTTASQQEMEAEWDDNLPRPPTGFRPATQSTLQRPHTSSSRPHTARPATSPQQQSAALDSTQTLVATLLHSSSAIRNIHSSHSLRALISSAHGGRPQQQHATSTAPANSVSVGIAAPLVSVVATRETMHGKINPSLLPYLHRHPAV